MSRILIVAFGIPRIYRTRAHSEASAKVADARQPYFVIRLTMIGETAVSNSISNPCKFADGYR